ncbi:MAG: UDP-glucose 4-epimerase GalE [Candidatus Azobacteroides pseudotrichonymphae]|nr:UDP-glucose 4-epimerase GalE [Bacteroidales bacterium OttesenSCG-928-I14]GMO35325.1 MAG: UDP-glucose 4-epimerase GalE [Candidatus Azobacteroides pseudotrichonymphae]
MKEKILVTGGTGYIGSHTTVELLNAGYEVIIVDNLSNSTLEVINGIKRITGIHVAFEKIDCICLNGLEKVLKKHSEIKGIIHFAAKKAVGESVQKPLFYYKNNLISLINILELMPKYKVEGIVFSSSCTVYGQPKHLPVDENTPIQPALSPYGNTKQINEEIICDNITAGASYKSIILRYFNPIGAHRSAEIGELSNRIPRNLVPFIIQTAMGIRNEISVFGNDYNTLDGSCVRDYIHVVDLAKAHVISMERVLNNKSNSRLEYFNLGTGKGTSVLEMINTFEKTIGIKVPYKIAERRKGDIEQIWANPLRANKILGWNAKETIEEALKSAWEWQLKQKHF